jgi:hypothetical protein
MCVRLVEHTAVEMMEYRALKRFRCKSFDKPTYFRLVINWEACAFTAPSLQSCAQRRKIALQWGVAQKVKIVVHYHFHFFTI